MIVTIDLLNVPTTCWVWTGVVGYCLLCYFLLGPVMVRWRERYDRRQGNRWDGSDEAFAVCFWLLSPVTVPFAVVRKLFFWTAHPFFSWLIFGCGC